MASLQESVIDPIELSNKINKINKINKRRDTIIASITDNSTNSIIDAADAESDDENETDNNTSTFTSANANIGESTGVKKVPDVINGIYQSMSGIIEALNADNAILNQQVDKLYSLLISNASTIREDLADVKKKTEIIVDLQKQIMDTRNILLQTLDINIKNLKKELSTENIRKLIREELKLL
jgi:hypothetical protein